MRPFALLALASLLAPVFCRARAAAPAAASPDAWRDDTLAAMGKELGRDFPLLRAKDFSPPYYLAFALKDVKSFEAWAAYGALQSSDSNRGAVIRVELRVGSPLLDDTRVGDYAQPTFSAPVEDDPMALRTAFWQLADAAFKDANEKYNDKMAYLVDHPGTEKLADFSYSTPTVLSDDFSPLSVPRAQIRRDLRQASAVMKDFPGLDGATLDLSVRRTRDFFVDSQGARVARQHQRWVLSLSAACQAKDGTPLQDEEADYYDTWAEVPSAAAMRRRLASFLSGFLRQRRAPLQAAYEGPALLSGAAAGVFIHEVMGHRLEGERQRDENEGQTFKDKVGRQVMPPFLSLYDDPRLAFWKGQPLNGHYEVDDQGVPARRADLVEKGKLVGFLMSRCPIKGFSGSNGHGRCDGYHRPCSRMGNLVLASSRTESRERLMRDLVRLCREQGKPYGLYFKRILGGDTVTEKGASQAFRGIPQEVYRVWASDGHLQLVRGVEIVGTPLDSIGRIVATGDKPVVFNGMCGAASGWVPVSSVTPPLLVSELEVQGQKAGRRRGRVLPPPFAGGARDAGK